MEEAKDFFENLGKNISKGVENVSRKAGDLVEIQRLKQKRYAAERLIERAYLKLGKNAYAAYSGGEVSDEQINFDEIDEAKEEVQKLNKQIAAMKGQEFCPYCESVLDNGSVFCNRCGRKLYEN